MSANRIIVIAAILGALAVVLGAFGAHKLGSLLNAERIEIYKIGINYQFYHALALFGLGVWSKHTDVASPTLRWSALCFLIGVCFFSGSLYLLACRELFGIAVLTPVLGPMTPIGGVFFIIGWALMASAAWGKEKK